jgi:STE24 endopeptidase
MGTVLFYELFTPIIAVFDFVTLALKRSYEFDSDSYAVKLGYGNELKNALIKLYVHKS